ncbi:porin family protein [Brucella pseudogrignonensis]|uniref:Opacity protein-like surface antigen n=1 Tax=Brucella pseudogrignonensis TaxID=419475 RepID=A0ABU1M3J7_9HYPH|nr:porin family protein [Brucella pseudogrignonensis]MDR6430392.1 opacity protein-like surface antigen [Brucella pseudogrignonensis]
MRYVSAIALISFGVLTATNGAKAADIVFEEPPVVVAPPAASNWYIRGDIGYNFKNKTDGHWDFWNQYAEENRGVDDTLRYDSLKLKAGASYGVGVGYRFNEMLRTDATLDFFRAGINGRTRCPSLVKMGMNPPLNLVDDNCKYEDSSTANIWTAMANAYVDLPKVGVVTPYLGAGLGAAYVKYGNWTDKQVCANNFPADCAQQFDKNGIDTWRFAMALMAGVSYDLTNQLKLDVGYRYLRINGGNAYGYDKYDRAEDTGYGHGVGASGAQGRDNGFNIHTVRAGLRYEFN